MMNFPEQFPTFTTERLLLRPLQAADAPALFSYFSDPEVMRYYDLEPLQTLDQAQSLVKRLMERFERQDGLRWAIVDRQTNQLIGSCGYNNFIRYAWRGNIGYDLARPFWGQGLVVEALRPMLAYGYQTLQLHRMEAYVMVENRGSKRVLEKLGFTEEGILRGYGYWQGKFWDLRCFSLLRPEWENNRDVKPTTF